MSFTKYSLLLFGALFTQKAALGVDIGVCDKKVDE